MARKALTLNMLKNLLWRHRRLAHKKDCQALKVGRANDERQAATKFVSRKIRIWVAITWREFHRVTGISGAHIAADIVLADHPNFSSVAPDIKCMNPRRFGPAATSKHMRRFSQPDPIAFRQILYRRAISLSTTIKVALTQRQVSGGTDIACDGKDTDKIHLFPSCQQNTQNRSADHGQNFNCRQHTLSLLLPEYNSHLVH